MSAPSLLRLAGRKMLYLFLYVLKVYVVVVIFVYLFQNYLLYVPPRYSVEKAREIADELGLRPYATSQSTATDPDPGRISSWDNVTYTLRDDFPLSTSSPAATYALPKAGAPGAAARRGTIIMAHGNGGTALYSAPFAYALAPLGFKVILYEYPGYGSNPGSPSEAGCVEPLQRLVREIAAEGRGPVYLFGQSLGCGVVCSALQDKTLPVAGVVLLQPWDTLAGVAGTHYPFLPVSLMVGNKYNSMAHLPHFTGPVAFVVCDNDTTIPPHLSRRLYDARTGPKLWLELPNSNHNSWPSDPDEPWWKTVTDFIAPLVPTTTATAPAPVTPAQP